MTPTPIRSLTPLPRSDEARCRICPPERVCAWDCIQGANAEEIVINSLLEQRASSAPDIATPSGTDDTSRALWEVYNS
ncbi:MAG TPA: hypothetical protein PKD09_13315 [Aggregatilinea sp.]|uniref:hypothetical protein n=1 Tax=Aggregatilinea sp. TaxID=2806333 RepID=UPI002C80E8E3|nr:hypothetical protein [Aggregatilinea sp.]HML22625.1 hypothetical protein [Aggregatilinea sp.]